MNIVTFALAQVGFGCCNSKSNQSCNSNTQSTGNCQSAGNCQAVANCQVSC